MSEHAHEPSSDGPAPEIADGMLAEAASVAADESGDEGLGTAAGAAEGPEPGTVADTGQPAGTADARAAGVMDTAEQELR